LRRKCGQLDCRQRNAERVDMEQAMSGWGCPHEINGECQRLKGRPCDPGMRGCVLHGRFVFSNPAKNRQQPSDSNEEVEADVRTPRTTQAPDHGSDQG